MIIFLFGADTFRSRQKLKEIKDKFLREVDSSGMNMQTLDGKTADFSLIENSLSTMPFLAKKRLVIIENLLAGKLHSKNAKQAVDLLQKKSTKETIIVFWEGELDEAKFKKNDIFLFLKKEKYQYGFNLLSSREIQRWITDKVTQMRGSMEPVAIAYLSDLVGNDLWLADSETTKLTMFAKGRPITMADVKTLCAQKLEENIFLLTDALGQKNNKLAIKLIHEQLSAGMAPTELLHKCLWHIKNLLAIRSILDDGDASDSYAIAQTLSLHPFVAKKGTSQAKNFKIEELKNIFNRLVQIDGIIKTSRANTEVLFDLLVMRG